MNKEVIKNSIYTNNHFPIQNNQKKSSFKIFIETKEEIPIKYNLIHYRKNIIFIYIYKVQISH